MQDTLRDQLERSIARAAESYYRLVLLVGKPESGKTTALQAAAESLDQSVVNLNLLLAERLLELTKKQRALRVRRILDEELDKVEDDAILLDNIELLFDPQLSQDPMRLLQGLSRSRTIISTWPGTFDGTHLTYAEPGHPEWRRYTEPEAVIVAIEGSHTIPMTSQHQSPRSGAQVKA